MAHHNHHIPRQSATNISTHGRISTQPSHPQITPQNFHTSHLTGANLGSQFHTKTVVLLNCKYCNGNLCQRGMRAILLADTSVELFSTDLPPVSSVQLVGDDYITKNCMCKIRDVGCLVCGNVVGYHVTRPCMLCLEACNNGHFWMFHSSSILPAPRMDPSGKNVMLWGSLPSATDDAALYRASSSAASPISASFSSSSSSSTAAYGRSVQLAPTHHHLSMAHGEEDSVPR
eukprot:Sdes_comp10865_c0_seq1m2520